MALQPALYRSAAFVGGWSLGAAGSYWNGSDAAEIRAQAEDLVRAGCDAEGIRQELGLPEPGMRRYVDPPGFYRGRRGVWRARVAVKSRVVLDLGASGCQPVVSPL